MKKNITTTKLSALLDEIASKHLDCQSCPVERSCCIAGGSYKINFKINEIKIIFDIFDFKDDYLPMNLQLDDKVNGDFIMRDMACPRYDVDIGCSLHNVKKKHNLKTCMRFPVCALDDSDLDIVTKYLYEGLFNDILCANINYYCYSVEKNWSHWARELISLSDQFDVPVKVIYLSKDGYPNSLDIMEFDVKLKEGIIPPQDDYKDG